MNKSEFIDAIAEGAGITKAAAGKALDAFINTVTTTLSKGDSIALPGFGSFVTDTRAARMGRNPRTGATMQIKASRVAKFRVGKKLKEAVQ